MSSPVNSATVLVVDDDPFGCELLRSMLQSLGISQVDVACNGRDALQHIAQASQPPDYLISDLFMPDMDGIDLINSLVASHYGGGVILLSGVDVEMLSLARDIAQGQGLKVLGAFVKPLQREALASLLGSSV